MTGSFSARYSTFREIFGFLLRVSLTLFICWNHIQLHDITDDKQSNYENITIQKHTGQARVGLGGKKVAQELWSLTGPLNTRRAANSMHRTYRPVIGLLGQIPKHLALFWMITKKLHHILNFRCP